MDPQGLQGGDLVHVLGAAKNGANFGGIGRSQRASLGAHGRGRGTRLYISFYTAFRSASRCACARSTSRPAVRAVSDRVSENDRKTAAGAGA